MSDEAAGLERFEARHFDGLTAESRPAEAWASADGVWVAGAGGARRWEFAELVLVRGDGRDEPVQIERRANPVEVLIVPDRAFLTALRGAVPPGFRLAKSGGWKPRPRVVAALLLAGLALMFSIWRFAIPALADFAARHVPVEWEKSYGDAIIAELGPDHERVQDPRVRRPAEEIHRMLQSAAGNRTGDMRLFVLKSEVPNAFAVPGGSVVVTTGLLGALGSPDELAAVIAHEHGHVRRG